MASDDDKLDGASVALGRVIGGVLGVLLMIFFLAPLNNDEQLRFRPVDSMEAMPLGTVLKFEPSGWECRVEAVGKKHLQLNCS